MLLSIKRPPLSAALQCVVCIVGHMLDYAAEYHDNRFSRPRLVAAVPLAEPLLAHSHFLDAYRALLKLDESERRAIRDSFYNDKDFHLRLNDQDFTFRCLGLSRSAKAIAKRLLKALYEAMSQGNGLGRPPMMSLDRIALTRGNLEASYWSANDCNVCPVCLEPMYDPSDSTTLVDCDHFFPLYKYPVLAVHPGNLAFVCPICNERRKGKKLPLTHNRAGALRETFLPYSRPACGEVEPLFLSDARYPVRLAVRSGSSPSAAIRLRNLERLYKLSAFLSLQLKRVYTSLVSEVCRGADVRSLRRQARKVLGGYGASAAAEDYVISRFAGWLVQHALDLFVDDCRDYLNTRQKARLEWLAERLHSGNGS